VLNLGVINPQFVDLLGGNFRLDFSSPLRNAGTAGFDAGPVDIVGEPRVSDGTIDLGAFENQEVRFKDGFE
jgi:hypothetical protein